MFLEKIQAILREQIGDDTLAITRETTLEEIGMDSLDFVQVIMELEDAFNVSIEDDQKFETVDALIRYIEQRQAAAAE